MIIKEFTKDVLEVQVQKWWDKHESFSEAWRAFIMHMETKFEALAEKIDNLEEELAEMKLQKSMTDHFKIGWVYKTAHNHDCLIINISGENMWATDLCDNTIFEYDIVCDIPTGLIRSTGKKWEPEE